ncbi:hypothetical protein AKJ09_08595 [Labilithrix luteola]|uniref:Uncharacterized protein n=1 Tax=Labilithrix luteola TaxID=1391654 RepID=A0A0K1Q8E6_9BACT|nr:hypothetical protein AKJ09_08595 [Labilithrix luteola]
MARVLGTPRPGGSSASPPAFGFLSTARKSSGERFPKQCEERCDGRALRRVKGPAEVGAAPAAHRGAPGEARKPGPHGRTGPLGDRARGRRKAAHDAPQAAGIHERVLVRSIDGNARVRRHYGRVADRAAQPMLGLVLGLGRLVGETLGLHLAEHAESLRDCRGRIVSFLHLLRSWASWYAAPRRAELDGRQEAATQE